MLCSCGNKAVMPLFKGKNISWGLCEEHLHRWEAHPLIYIDGLGTNGVSFLLNNIDAIRYRKPYSDVVISYPTNVEGVGTYTDRAVEAVHRMAEYMKALNVKDIPETKPILFVNSPFSVFFNCLLMEPNRAEQLAVHHLLRPAVWILVSHDGRYNEVLKTLVKTAHQTQPFTFTRFMIVGKAVQSYWLPIKIAYNLWIQFSTYRKRNKGVKTNADSRETGSLLSDKTGTEDESNDRPEDTED